MASRSSHNKNNAGVKRILQEARELATDPSTDYHAAPLEDDIFEWHCTMRGPSGTEFEGGIYHFRIQLPSEYPFRPPSIMMLTPNGRFELNTKYIVIDHEELWQPAWGVRTAIIALQGFFPLKGEAAIGVGAVEYPSQERKRLAQLSRDWKCIRCEQTNLELLPDVTPAAKATNGSSLGVVEPEGLHERESSSTSVVPPPDPPAPAIDPAVTTSTTVPSSQPLQHIPIQPLRQSLVQSPRSSRPPLLLDGAIAVCFTMLVAILWKRLL
ncbi:UBC-like protein [Hysterangium stoloniferum]|nr:UBC-like protein [Hysterangium stoloniferum]